MVPGPGDPVFLVPDTRNIYRLFMEFVRRDTRGEHIPNNRTTLHFNAAGLFQHTEVGGRSIESQRGTVPVSHRVNLNPAAQLAGCVKRRQKGKIRPSQRKETYSFCTRRCPFTDQPASFESILQETGRNPGCDSMCQFLCAGT